MSGKDETVDWVKCDFRPGLRGIHGAWTVDSHHVSRQDAFHIICDHGYFLGQGACTQDAVIFCSASL